MIELMLNSNQIYKPGVSFLEILVVLLALGIISSFILPTFLTRGSNAPKIAFCAEFATLMHESLESAIITNKVHQIFFDIDERKVVAKIHEPANAQTSEPDKFVPIQNAINIPSSLEIRNFFINDKDDFASGSHISTIFFYIMPDGTSQAIIINIEDVEATLQNNKLSITVNPFYSQLKEYDTFQKP